MEAADDPKPRPEHWVGGLIEKLLTRVRSEQGLGHFRTTSRVSFGERGLCHARSTLETKRAEYYEKKFCRHCAMRNSFGNDHIVLGAFGMIMPILTRALSVGGPGNIEFRSNFSDSRYLFRRCSPRRARGVTGATCERDRHAQTSNLTQSYHTNLGPLFGIIGSAPKYGCRL